MKIDEVFEAWVPWQNTDLTEGRGTSKPLCICKLRSTAIRRGKKNGVQGSDCPVTKEKAFKIGTKTYSIVCIEYPTNDDKQNEKNLLEIEAIEKKALAAGLSKDELATLKERL